jgi:hypothetical protein
MRLQKAGVYEQFNVGVYGVDIHVFFQTEMTKVREDMQDREILTEVGGDFFTDDCKGGFAMSGNVGACWFVPNKYLIGNIHHESVHLACGILDRVGVVICRESEEALTYLSQHIFEQVLEILKPYIK